MKTSEPPVLKIGDLARRSGVSVATIRHYLREGLLGDGQEIKRTSRNMAYYPVAFVERVALIRRLQQERFMPLKVIREMLRDDPDRVGALIEAEDRIVDAAVARAEQRDGGRSISRAQVTRRYEIPAKVLDRLEEIGVLSPRPGGYDGEDVKIIEAIFRFRAGGYEERLGFTVYDTLRYKTALEPLVAEEVRALLDRLTGEVDVQHAVEIIAAGVEPLRELIGAMHSKALLSELTRQRRVETPGA